MVTVPEADMIADRTLIRDGHLDNYTDPGSDKVSFATWSAQVNTALHTANQNVADAETAAKAAAASAKAANDALTAMKGQNALDRAALLAAIAAIPGSTPPAGDVPATVHFPTTGG